MPFGYSRAQLEEQLALKVHLAEQADNPQTAELHQRLACMYFRLLALSGGELRAQTRSEPEGYGRRKADRRSQESLPQARDAPCLLDPGRRAREGSRVHARIVHARDSRAHDHRGGGAAADLLVTRCKPHGRRCGNDRNGDGDYHPKTDCS
ncbi:hypothetical protein BV96_04696 [Sphingomonas paucimobilis]|nr:hypothetical protein BV96_04696 [Sphingomonas paucimobilis]